MIPVIVLLLLVASCSREELDGFDNKIHFAHDFTIDAASGDTVYSLYMPSGFTPNDDGINDYYGVYGTGIDPSGFEMRVYSREGNLIYSSDDPYKYYDGTTLGYGTLNPGGLYTVKLIVTDILAVEHRYTYDIYQCN